MGRDLLWYVLPKPLPAHDTTKKYCFGYEYEPENPKESFVEKIGTPDSVYDGGDLSEIAKRLRAHQKAIEKTYYESWDAPEEWCPVCLMYSRSMFENVMVLASHHVRHSYGNPVWSSRWNVKDTWMGDSDSQFCRRFSRDRLYREISASDVARARRDLEDLGDPIRDSDREARAETMEVLDFLDEWVHRDDAIVIFQDEF